MPELTVVDMIDAPDNLFVHGGPTEATMAMFLSKTAETSKTGRRSKPGQAWIVIPTAKWDVIKESTDPFWGVNKVVDSSDEQKREGKIETTYFHCLVENRGYRAQCRTEKVEKANANAGMTTRAAQLIKDEIADTKLRRSGRYVDFDCGCFLVVAYCPHDRFAWVQGRRRDRVWCQDDCSVLGVTPEP